MVKRNEEGSRSWAFIFYGEFNDNLMTKDLPDICKLCISSPLHSPDISEQQRQKELDELTDKYAEKIKRAKKIEQKQALEKELEEKVEKILKKELKSHYHFLMHFARRVRRTTAEKIKNELMLNDEDQLQLTTRVERVSDFEAYFRYLFHVDNVEKEQFDCNNDVFYISHVEKYKFYKYRFLAKKYLSDSERKEDILWSIVNFIHINRIDNFADVHKTIKIAYNKCDEEYYDALAIVRKNNAFFARILSENRHFNGN